MRSKRSIMTLLIVVAALMSQSFQVNSTQDREYTLKAAFLYRFLDYVEWVDLSGSQPINISVAGESPIVKGLELLSRAAKPGSKHITVKSILETEDPPPCEVLFISRNSRVSIESLIRRTESRPTLIITETSGALEKGSHINFLVVENKLRFEINLKNTTRAGLKLSSQLLQHASTIKR